MSVSDNDQNQSRRFRKKPVVIEAVPASVVMFSPWDLPAWVVSAEESGVLRVFGDHFEVHTLEGIMEGGPGDWLIQGVQGELYPCQHDIFMATYEAADDGS